MKISKCGINLYETLTSGQCFRAEELGDGSFNVVLKDRVINVREDKEYLIVYSNNDENLESVLKDYFDLNTSYNKINKELVSSNDEFKSIVDGCEGYRVLKQDPLEMLISYIISQNNNVKRISKSIEVFCKLYGEKVGFNDNEFYLFPTIDRIKEIDLEKLEPLKVGFRDKYIMSAVEMLNKDDVFLDKLNGMNTDEALEYLMKIKGVGMKVASCILLFAYARYDTYPIDTWVKKFVNDFYKIDGDVKVIKEFLVNKFSKYTGLAIQYMFHYNRNLNNL